MAKLTKASRRRAALKGWRNRSKKRNPVKRKRKTSAKKRISSALKKYMRSLKNPAPKVKGRKVKGGRAVSLKNFTGSVIRKSNGQVLIRGKAKKR